MCHAHEFIFLSHLKHEKIVYIFSGSVINGIHWQSLLWRNSYQASLYSQLNIFSMKQLLKPSVLEQS